MNTREQDIRYRLLKLLSDDPDLSQRAMAEKMNISLGKVNFFLSELAKKGLIKIGRFSRSPSKRKYLYRLTPRGIEEKGRLTLRFLKRKMTEYDEIRRQIETLSKEARDQGLIDDLDTGDALHHIKS